MDETVEIRKLSGGETSLAKELIRLFGNDDQNRLPPSDTYVRDMLAREDFHVVVALEDGRLVGGLTAYELKMFKRETTEMFLYEIEVRENYRQKGIGTRLIERLKEICRQKGIVEMFVGTEKANTAARALYSGTGGAADADSVWFNYKFE